MGAYSRGDRGFMFVQTKASLIEQLSEDNSTLISEIHFKGQWNECRKWYVLKGGMKFWIESIDKGDKANWDEIFWHWQDKLHAIETGSVKGLS